MVIGHGKMLLSRSPAQTEAIAAELAHCLGPGQCVGLYGELGSGKTQFVRGLVRGLGGQAALVSSPTFVLVKIYEGGRLTVYHLDAYRVGGPQDFEGIGFRELLDQEGLVVVEWADRVQALLPAGHVRVELITTGRRTRQIRIENA